LAQLAHPLAYNYVATGVKTLSSKRKRWSDQRRMTWNPHNLGWDQPMKVAVAGNGNPLFRYSDASSFDSPNTTPQPSDARHEITRHLAPDSNQHISRESSPPRKRPGRAGRRQCPQCRRAKRGDKACILRICWVADGSVKRISKIANGAVLPVCGKASPVASGYTARNGKNGSKTKPRKRLQPGWMWAGSGKRPRLNDESGLRSKPTAPRPQ